MKKTVAILLALFLFLLPMAAWAEGEEPLDEQTVLELQQAVFEANQLDALFSRYTSARFLFPDPEAPDGYDVIWETKEIYYQSFADWFAHWEKDQVYYEMRWNKESDSPSLTAGYVYDPYYTQYAFVGDDYSEFFDTEHESVLPSYKKDGKLYLASAFDETKSQNTLEEQGLTYTGETVRTMLIVDASTLDILEFTKFLEKDGEETAFYHMDVAYDQPEPVACRLLRSAMERGNANYIQVTCVFDHGTDHELVKTLALPANTDFQIQSSTPYVCFLDPDCTTISGWDVMSDATLYFFMDPDEELTTRYMDLYDALVEAQP